MANAAKNRFIHGAGAICGAYLIWRGIESSGVRAGVMAAVGAIVLLGNAYAVARPTTRFR